MTDAEPGGSTAETDLEAAIESRLASLDSGNYRANNQLVLDAFKNYLENQRGVTSLEDLEVIDCPAVCSVAS